MQYKKMAEKSTHIENYSEQFQVILCPQDQASQLHRTELLETTVSFSNQGRLNYSYWAGLRKMDRSWTNKVDAECFLNDLNKATLEPQLAFPLSFKNYESSVHVQLSPFAAHLKLSQLC